MWEGFFVQNRVGNTYSRPQPAPPACSYCQVSSVCWGIQTPVLKLRAASLAYVGLAHDHDSLARWVRAISLLVIVLKKRQMNTSENIPRIQGTVWHFRISLEQKQEYTVKHPAMNSGAGSDMEAQRLSLLVGETETSTFSPNTRWRICLFKTVFNWGTPPVLVKSNTWTNELNMPHQQWVVNLTWTKMCFVLSKRVSWYPYWLTGWHCRRAVDHGSTTLGESIPKVIN